MSINSVSLTGNLTRDPELRQTNTGFSIANFSIAVNERVKENDEWTDRPSFFDCTILGKRAESICKYLSKGSKVAINGKLRQNRWEKDGQKHSKVDIIVDEVEFLSTKPATEATADDIYGAMGVSAYAEDIPF